MILGKVTKSKYLVPMPEQRTWTKTQRLLLTLKFHVLDGLFILVSPWILFLTQGFFSFFIVSLQFSSFLWNWERAEASQRFPVGMMVAGWPHLLPILRVKFAPMLLGQTWRRKALPGPCPTEPGLALLLCWSPVGLFWQATTSRTSWDWHSSESGLQPRETSTFPSNLRCLAVSQLWVCCSTSCNGQDRPPE